MTTPHTYNFAAGPAILPAPVIEETREALRDLLGSGIGLLEHSHRGAAVDEVFASTHAACREVAGLSDDYRILFLQGGASLQFMMLPANLLPEGRTADYLETGSWSKKAIAQAVRYGGVHVAASSAETNFDRIPTGDALHWSASPAYVHFTSNNTIYGTQYREEPTPPEGAWLACDASSDVFSRPLDVDRYGVLYAGAQKNLGPAGATLVLIRADLLERVERDLPEMLRYGLHAENDSRYNTPPVLSIYVMGRVLRWILDSGGLAGVEKRNEEKAALLYDAIDASEFYRGTAQPDSRSRMNVTFRIASESLEAQFLAEAAAAGFSGLGGHRAVGGIRASIYIAFPREGCEALAAFRRDFEARHG